MSIVKDNKPTELIKRIDEFFGFYDPFKASDILMKEVMKNDLTLYPRFKKEVLDKIDLKGKNTFQYDAMYHWYSFYLSDPRKGQYFTPDSICSLLSSLVGENKNMKESIRSASRKLIEEVDVDKKDLGTLRYLSEECLFYSSPLTCVTKLEDIARKYKYPFGELDIRLPLRIHDMTCGVGSLIVDTWYDNVSDFYPGNFHFTEIIAIVMDISEHVIPFLLFNLAYRGIQSIVMHGDALTAETFNVYKVIPRLKEYDKLLPYGEIYKIDISKESKLRELNSHLGVELKYYKEGCADYVKNYSKRFK